MLITAIASKTTKFANWYFYCCVLDFGIALIRDCVGRYKMTFTNQESHTDQGKYNITFYAATYLLMNRIYQIKQIPLAYPLCHI